MGNKTFFGVMIAMLLLLTAALAYAVIDNRPDVSGIADGNDPGNSISSSPLLEIKKTGNLTMVVYDWGSGTPLDVMLFRPAAIDDGWYLIGDLAEPYYGNASHQVTLVRVNQAGDPGQPALLAPPTGWRQVWSSHHTSMRIGMSVWQPIPPRGYVALGCVAVKDAGYNQPVIPEFRCVRADLCTKGVESRLLWNDNKTGADRDISLWGITPADGNGLDASTFWTHPDYKPNPGDNVYCLDKRYIA